MSPDNLRNSEYPGDMVGRPPDEEAVFDRDIATKSTGGTKDPAPIDGLVPTGIKVYGLKVMTQPAPAKKQ